MRHFRIKRRLAKRSRGPVRLRLESLESRTLLSVDVQLAAEGINAQESTCGCEPPDPDAAAGPDYVVGTVNTAIAYYNKADGSRRFLQSLRTFFAPINPGAELSDPVVTYDEMSGRFFVGILDLGFSSQRSFFDFAVSNTSNPFDGFAEMHKVETTETLASGDKVWSDYPKLGFNADAFVVTLNMDLFSDPVGTNPDHGQIIVFDKRSVLDGDPSTLTLYRSDLPGPVYAPDPATMHGAPPGAPLYFVREVTRFGGDSIAVLRMTDYLSDNPTFTETDLPVTPYDRPPRARAPVANIETFESFFLNADWRDNRLVATHHIGVAGVVRARWYEFSTAGEEPSLTQQGDIDQGPGVYTYFSAIAVAPNGDLGMTFEESSATEFLSMYVTGQALGDAPGTMQTPVASHPGTSQYHGTRAGDYGGITVDPNTDHLFWAENMYKGSDNSSWNTGIALFDVSPQSRKHHLRPVLPPEPVPFFPGVLPGQATSQVLSADGRTGSGPGSRPSPVDGSAARPEWPRRPVVPVPNPDDFFASALRETSTPFLPKAGQLEGPSPEESVAEPLQQDSIGLVL